jgi:hypothetical protein
MKPDTIREFLALRGVHLVLAHCLKHLEWRASIGEILVVRFTARAACAAALREYRKAKR